MKSSNENPIVRKVLLHDSESINTLIETNGGAAMMKQGFGSFSVGNLIESTIVNFTVQLNDGKLAAYINLNDSIRISAEIRSFEEALESIVEFLPATVS